MRIDTKENIYLYLNVFLYLGDYKLWRTNLFSRLDLIDHYDVMVTTKVLNNYYIYYVSKEKTKLGKSEGKIDIIKVF